MECSVSVQQKVPHLQGRYVIWNFTAEGEMSQRFDKRAMNFLPPATQTAIIRSPGTKCIIYNPQPALSSRRTALLLKTLEDPDSRHTTPCLLPTKPHPWKPAWTQQDVAAFGWKSPLGADFYLLYDVPSVIPKIPQHMVMWPPPSHG